MRMQGGLISVRRLTGRNAVAASCLSRNYGRTFCSVVEGGESSSCAKAEDKTDKGEKFEETSKAEPYDIAIVGGGMVGMAVACALSRNPMTKHLTVAIIDNNPALGFKTSFKRSEIPDPRVSTVTPATISFFRDIGAWEYVLQQRHAYFDKMQVWDYTGLGYTRYNARDVGKECLGCVVENKVLHYSLLSSFQSGEGLQWTLYPARLTSMTVPSPRPVSSGIVSQPDPEGSPRGRFVKLDLSDGNTIHARLVVGADGSKSNVREMAALKSTQRSYSQSAIICTVEHAVENDCAWQRFLPSGPIALLPVGDRFSNVVWTMRPEEASARKSMDGDDLAKAINHAMDDGHGPQPGSGVLGGYVEKISSFAGWWGPSSSAAEPFQAPPRVTVVTSERMVFPLSLMHAHDYVSRRVALVGDAAHTVHPLAGQGVNMGFGDASALAKVIAEGVSVGADLGELTLLKRYEKERKAANATMMAILDGFQKAFAVDAGPLNLLRAAAFHGAHFIPPLKRNIIAASSVSNSPPAAPVFPSANSTSRHSHLSSPSVSELFYGNPADAAQLSFPTGSSFEGEDYGIQRQTAVDTTPSLTDLLAENSFTASNPYLSLYTTFQAQMGSGNSTSLTNIKSERMTTISGHDHCFNWPLAPHQSTPEATLEIEPSLYWNTLAAAGFGGGTLI